MHRKLYGKENALHFEKASDKIAVIES